MSYVEALPVQRQRVEFLNVLFDPVDFQEVLQKLDKCERSSSYRYIVTPNVDHIVRINRNDSIRECYDRAWMSLCDSSPVSALAALVGIHLPIVTGSDLTAQLFQTVIRENDRVSMIIADEEIGQRMMKRYPHVNFRYHVPPYNLMNNAGALEECISFLAEQPSRFSFIAVGSPQSERIAFGLSEHPDARGVAICCGASIEFLVCLQRRAPPVLRGSGFEWLYRLASNPRGLWRRYLFSVVPLALLMGAEVFKTFRKARR